MAYDEKKKLTKKEADTLLAEVKSNFDYDLRTWRDCRDEYALNMKALTDPWNPADRTDRETAGRPCVTFDELNQYVNQIINDLRANPRGAKFSPTGNGANDKTARFYQDKWREIEYRSDAQTAYIAAAESAIQGGMGWVRLNMEYASDRSFYKELRIEPIPNAMSVLVDANTLRPDSSDMKRLFCFESIPTKTFASEYPWAEIRSFSSELMAESAGWVTEQNIRIAEYWKVETYERELRLYQARDGRTVEAFADELEQPEIAQAIKGAKVALRRAVDYPKVCQYLTNGVEILKKTPWKGKYIPFASVYGKILWVDEGKGPERKILSAISMARDPYMAYCWVRSMEIETIGTITRNPYWAYEGQLDPGQLEEIKKSLHEPVAVLTAKAKIESMTGEQILPLPARNPLSVDISAYSIAAENYRRAVQSAMAMSFLPTDAQKQNQKSGKALDRIEASGQKGSYHFTDGFNGLIRRLAEIGEDLMDKAIDTSRDVTVVKPDGSTENVKVITDGSQDDTGADNEYSVKGDHAVTISVGPEQASEREEVNDLLTNMSTSAEVIQVLGPQKSAKMMAAAVRARNIGPMGDKIADIIDPGDPEGPDGKPLSPQVQAKLQQAQQMIELAKQEIAEKDKIIETDQIKAQNDYRKAELQAKVDIAKAKIDALTKLRIARDTASSKVHDTDTDADVKRDIAALEAEIERVKLAFEQREAEKDRQHEKETLKTQARIAEAQAENAHERGLEAGEVDHQHGMESQTQAEQSAAQQASENGAGA